MSFIHNSLSNNEKVQHLFSFHWLIWLRPSLFGLFSILTLIVGSLVDTTVYQLGLSLTLGCVIYVIYLFFDIKNSERGITERRVIAKEGIFSTTSNELRLDEVESINLHQDIAEKIVGSGKLVLSGTGNKRLVMTFLENPFLAKRQIEELVENSRV